MPHTGSVAIALPRFLDGFTRHFTVLPTTPDSLDSIVIVEVFNGNCLIAAMKPVPPEKSSADMVVKNALDSRY
jgi:hypothetical protein